jgi:hypothetical protein
MEIAQVFDNAASTALEELGMVVQEGNEWISAGFMAISSILAPGCASAFGLVFFSLSLLSPFNPGISPMDGSNL